MPVKKEIIGDRVGQLIVVKKVENYGYGNYKYVCLCDCGNVTLVSRGNLVCKKVLSCGCMKRELLAKRNSEKVGTFRFDHHEHIGKKNNMLTITRYLGASRDRKIKYECTCDCGKKRILTFGEFKRMSSCGCESPKRQYKLKENLFWFDSGIGYGKTYDNHVFKFDEEDYDKIKGFYWCSSANGYLISSKRGKKAKRMHRVIMDIDDIGIIVDHINHDVRDNRKINLRIATASENNINSKLNKNNSSGKSGVYHVSKKWISYGFLNKERIFLGSYNTFEEAKASREAWEEENHGEFKYRKENDVRLV